jgi:hypothetical protein
VSKQVRRYALFEAGPFRRGLTGVPNDFRGNRFIRAPAVDRAGKQPGLRLHPAPVPAQGLQQLGAERNVAVALPFAALNVDQHGFTVDVFDLQVAQFAIAHARGVEHHQQSAIHQVASGIKQPAHFFPTDNDGQPPRHFGKGDVLQPIGTLERLDEKESQS